MVIESNPGRPSGRKYDSRLAELWAEAARWKNELRRVQAEFKREQEARLHFEKEVGVRESLLEGVAKTARMILTGRHWSHTIQAALALLGETTHVDRVYIFENALGPAGNLLSSQRFEWARPGIEPQIDNPDLQDVDFELFGFGRWLKMLRENHAIFGDVESFPDSERDLLTVQAIVSLVVVPIFAGDEWWGFMGFDSVVARRRWTAPEVNILVAAASIIGAAIRRDRDYEETLLGWGKALELRHKETEGHTQRVADLAVQLALALDYPAEELSSLRWGALLHDIGKMAISDAILNKPGPLTDEEWVEMRRHPGFAAEIIQPIAFLNPAVAIPLYHHERWDGSGYPIGLSGENIPLPARIFAVADVWDALISDRPYRQAWPTAKALTYLQENAGVQFDPAVVAAFLDLVTRPPGQDEGE